MLMGPPGTGKTMLANRLTGLLPDLSEEEALEIAAVASVSMNGFDSATWRQIPFRAPHHTSSAAALVGGGRPPRPGEVSLAHCGVLLLDELPEYHRHVLESLREPLEFGLITISRAAFQTTFPAKFQFVATMNPCPCGYASSPEQECRCSPEQVKRYLAKISGPLLDRIDMHVEVARLPADILTKAGLVKEEDSQTVRERVIQCRAYQYERQGKCNAALSASEIESKIVLEESAIALLNQVMTRFNLSARVYHRIIKLARTLADLNACRDISKSHISEAISYRCLDRARNA
jgi:magnesium chelatase family protein